MPTYKILSTDHSHTSAIIDARHPAAALQALTTLECDEANVLEDERYIFSARKGPAGAWTIFQRIPWPKRPAILRSRLRAVQSGLAN